MTDVPEDDLADLVAALRGDRTQDDFAALVGISASLVGHVETRRRNLGPDSIDKIVDALGLSELERQRLRRARAAYAAKPDKRDDLTRLREVVELQAQVLMLLIRETRERLGDDSELGERLADLELVLGRQRLP